MIIDFRVRPPFGSFRRFFPAATDPDLSDDQALERFVRDLRDCGVAAAVIMGRHIAPLPAAAAGAMANEDIAVMMARYPGFFHGFGSVDVSDRDGAMDEISRLADAGFSGVAFDNPLAVTPRYDDDEYLYPVYARAAAEGLIIALTASGLVGNSVAYAHPAHVQAVAQAFPGTPVVVPHACWPWSRQAVGAVLQSLLQQTSRLYLIPDVYMHTAAPGRQDYADAIRWQEVAGWAGTGTPLSSRFLYASSYPVQGVRAATRAFDAFDFDEQTRRRVLYDNAAALLGIA